MATLTLGRKGGFGLGTLTLGKGGVPANAITLNGRPIKLNGRYITLTPVSP